MVMSTKCGGFHPTQSMQSMQEKYVTKATNVVDAMAKMQGETRSLRRLRWTETALYSFTLATLL